MTDPHHFTPRMLKALHGLNSGLYADSLPPRNYAADAIKLARLAEVFANAPANEIAPHLTVLAQASADLDRTIGGLFDD